MFCSKRLCARYDLILHPAEHHRRIRHECVCGTSSSHHPHATVRFPGYHSTVQTLFFAGRTPGRRAGADWFDPSRDHNTTSQVSNTASSRRTVVREDWAWLLLLAVLAGRRLVEFVVVDPDCLSGAGEPVGQHGGGGLPREPWIGAIEPERQTFQSPCPPHDGHRRRPGGKGEKGRGSRSCPLCRAGYIEAGRQGVRPDRWCWAPQNR